MDQSVRTVFQDTLRQALDTYHPHWETGRKGKGQVAQAEVFIQVGADTFHAWIQTSQRPKPGKWSAFLEEAAFPPDVHQSLVQRYRDLQPAKAAPQPLMSEASNLLPEALLTMTAVPPRRVGWHWPLTQRTRLGLLCVCLIVLLTLILLRVVVGQHEASGPGNGWCVTIPQGFSSAVGAAPLYMFVRGDTPLGDFASHPYYVYFHDQYVSAEVANLETLNVDDHHWQFRINPAWITTQADWNSPTAWRINYLCPPDESGR